jgi:hypothetical protein
MEDFAMSRTRPTVSELLLPPELRDLGGTAYAHETQVTGDDDVVGVVTTPRDFARGGQAGALRPTGRQAGLAQIVPLLVPYLDQTLINVGFQPSDSPHKAVSDGVCDMVTVSAGRAFNAVGNGYLAFSVDAPVSVSNLTQWGGGCVPVAQYYIPDLSAFTLRLQPGRHYVDAVICYLQAQGSAAILCPCTVTFTNSRGLF